MVERPDAVVLTGDLSEDEFRFHATAIYASGGMILSGDDLTKISTERLGMLKRLLPATGVAARFEDESMQVGMMELEDAGRWPSSTGKTIDRVSRFGYPNLFTLPISGAANRWPSTRCLRYKGHAAHSARLLVCKR
jgi:hypothetical protein